MRKIKNFIIPIILLAFIVTGCSGEEKDSSNSVDDSNVPPTEIKSDIELVTNPSVEYVFAGLSQLETVIGIEIDPDGGQGDNVVATVFFSSDMVDQTAFDEDDTIAEKGTKSGGSIDIFSTEEDAVARDKYLKKFDGKWVLDSGSHKVLGTLVIRTSSSLSEEDQELLTSQISDILTSGEITDIMVEAANEKIVEEQKLIQEATEKEKYEKEKIKVGISSSDLLSIKYEDAVDKLKSNGFININTSCQIADCGKENDGKTTRITINGVESFESKDKFHPSDEIVVYYNQAKKVTPPDIWYNLLERHYEEIEKLFVDAGFTNVVTKAHEIDYSENSFEGSVVNICIGEDNVTYDSDEEFYPDIQVRIDYRVKSKATPSPSPTETTIIEDEETIEENPYTPLYDYDLYYKTEFAHYDSDVIRLGNGEKAWIYIEASPATLTADDFYIDYDDSMLEIVDICENVSSNKVEIELVVRAKKAGSSEMLIASMYELYEYYDDAGCYTIIIKSLNSTEGRVVYVSSTGEKYHYSSNCIASGIKTTLDDAKVLEYEPCGKCVG